METAVACTFEASQYYCLENELDNNGRPFGEKDLVSSIPHSGMSLGSKSAVFIDDAKHHTEVFYDRTGIRRKTRFFSGSHGFRGRKKRKPGCDTIRHFAMG